jgi:hypothetical protein
MQTGQLKKGSQNKIKSLLKLAELLIQTKEQLLNKIKQMLHELLEKYTSQFPLIVDIKNIGVNSISVPIFDAAWAADHGQVAITTPVKSISYKDICHQINQGLSKFNLVTFELVSGDKAKFKEKLAGEMIYDDKGKIKVNIPVVPVPVIEHSDNLRYFLCEFILHPGKSQYKIDIPGGCQVRISLYPVDITPKEIESIKKESAEAPVSTTQFDSFENTYRCPIMLDVDTFGIIGIISDGLQCSMEKAMVALTEIGLLNMLAYPTGNESEKLKEILGGEKWKPILEKLKAVWSA